MQTPLLPLAGALAALLPAVAAAQSGTWSDEFRRPGLNGRGFAVGSWNGELVVGGQEFTVETPFGEELARFDGEKWHGIGGGVNGIVRAVQEFQGDLIVAGEFSSAGGMPATSIARWDGAAWHPLGTGLTLWTYDLGVVFDLEVWNGDLVAAGFFTEASGQPAIGVARWDGVQRHALGGGVGGAWEPKGLALLAASDGSLYVGGEFDTAGGVPARGIARFDGTSWHAVGGGVQAPPLSGVHALAEFQGRIYAGGEFSQIGGVAADKIAAFDGSSWAPLGGGVPDWDISTVVASMQVFQNSLYVGGDFMRVDPKGGTDLGLPAPRVARWDGSQWHSIGGVDGSDLATVVIDMAVVDDRLHLAGEFTVAGHSLGASEGVVSVSIVAFDGTDWLTVGKGLAMETGVADFTRWRDKLVAVGMFSEAGGSIAYHLAVFEDGDWRGIAKIDGNVWEAIEFEGDLVITGEFSKIDGQPISGTARYDGEKWKPMPLGGGTLEVHDGTLYAASLGQPRRWNGTMFEPFGPEPIFGSTYDLHSHEGLLYMCGSYNSAPGKGILVWDGQHISPVGGGLNDIGYQMTSWEGDLLVGGEFSHAGGVFTGRLARWDGAQWHAMGQPFDGLGAREFAVLDGELYVGGDLMTGMSHPLDGLARWDGSQWQPVGGGHVGPVGALFADETEKALWVSGSFHEIQGIPCFVLARFDLDTPWANLGQGLAGAHGTPLLGGVGDLVPGTPFGVTLENVPAGSTAMVVLGTSALHLPLLGGTLVPFPSDVLYLPTTPDGTAGLTAPWPGALPSGASLWLQSWNLDPGAPFGAAASNALQVTAP